MVNFQVTLGWRFDKVNDGTDRNNRADARLAERQVGGTCPEPAKLRREAKRRTSPKQRKRKMVRFERFQLPDLPLHILPMKFGSLPRSMVHMVISPQLFLSVRLD